MEDAHTVAAQQVHNSLPLQKRKKEKEKRQFQKMLVAIFAKLQHFTPSPNM